MSEPTSAQEEAAADAMLDSQIAELMEARYYAGTSNLPAPEWTPEPDAPPILVEVELETRR